MAKPFVMPDAVRPPDDEEYCKALIFGPHSAGKTRLLSTADEDERSHPMLFLAADAGTKTLVGGPSQHVWRMRDARDYAEALKTLEHPDQPFLSVGLDSLSEAQTEGILDILDNTDTKGRQDPDLMGQPDWGIILVRMKRLIRRFKNLDMHVFFTALAEDVSTKTGASKAPLVQGQFQKDLPGLMDVVAYLALEDLEDGGQERILLLHDFPRFGVKTRTPWNVEVPTEIVDPTITKLLDALGYK